jgi:serine/threonine protein kinase
MLRHAIGANVLTLDELIEKLESAGILAKGAVRNVRSSVTEIDERNSERDFIDELKNRSLLTDYQAEEISAGHADRLVIGTYILLDRIGRGGMGQIFRARHVLMKRDVAIKFMLPPKGYSGDAVWRFKREVEAAARLDHPRIVRALDAGERDGGWYLVMEYVAGLNLRQLVRSSGVVTLPRALRFTQQIAEGLVYAHRKGVIHRDIKPSNVLLKSNVDDVKILDMGLATLQPETDLEELTSAGEDSTSFGQILGTLDFMAPEQFADSKHVDARADIYSLGCTLYYLLVGKPPYGGQGLMQGVANRNSRGVDIRASQPDIPDSVQKLFAWMTQKDVNQRCPSASDLLRELNDVCRSEALHDQVFGESIVSTIRIDQAPKKRDRRRQQVLWGTTLLAVLVIGIGGLVWWPNRNGRSRTAREQPLPTRSEGSTPIPPTRATLANVVWPVNLLETIDPVRDTAAGESWRVESGSLFTGTGMGTRLNITHAVPASYRLSLKVTRTSGDGPLVAGLVIGDHHCFVLIDRKGTWGVGVDRDGKMVGVASSIQLELDRLRQLDIEVRSNEIHILLDGHSVCDWSGEWDELRLGQGWRPPSELHLFLATNNNAMFSFDELVLDSLE